MDKELFRTEVEPKPLDNPITYADRLLLMGSCFTENIGNRLAGLKFKAQLNPFGIVFNPHSLAQSLERIVIGRPYTLADLEQVNDRWVSFDHHGRYAGESTDEVLEVINTDLARAHQQLPETRFLILTFGSAWAYRHLVQDRIVANCPQSTQFGFSQGIFGFEQAYRTLSAVVGRSPK